MEWLLTDPWTAEQGLEQNLSNLQATVNRLKAVHVISVHTQKIVY